MVDFKKREKGDVKRNRYFYLWAILLLFAALWGLGAIVTGELTSKSGGVLLEGKAAVLAGLFIVAFASFALYQLVAKVKKVELEKEHFQKLESFEKQVMGYDTKFEILPSLVMYGKSPLPGFYYVLEVLLTKQIPFNLNIRQRDKVECFLWKTGLTRFLDVLTGNYYFDSKYRVSTTDSEQFKRVFNDKVIRLLEEFDHDCPPIRVKQGRLEIVPGKIRYIEGPYMEAKNLIDPHRGNIEQVLGELVTIVAEIEKADIPI